MAIGSFLENKVYLYNLPEICETSISIFGCTDPIAINYDSDATEDDGIVNTHLDPVTINHQSHIMDMNMI